jgi:hypothetical protein
MCGLILEIGMLIFGLVGLISGKLTISKKVKVVGTPARITGVILMLPLPLALALGFMLGILLGNSVSLSDLQTIATIAELLLIFACLVIAYLYANANKVLEIPATSFPTQPPPTPPLQ